MAKAYQIKLPTITELDLAVGDPINNVQTKLNSWFATYPQHDFKTGDVLIIESNEYSYIYEKNYNMAYALAVDIVTERLSIPPQIKVGDSTTLSPNHWKEVIPNLYGITPDQSLLQSLWFEETYEDDTIAITTVNSEQWVFVIDTPDSFVLTPSDFTDIVHSNHSDLVYTLDPTHRTPYDHFEKVVYISIRNQIPDIDYTLTGDYYPHSVY